jgi:DNA repair exonuclease SbcCD nuclease subunit
MAVTFLHTADWQLGKPYARVEDAAKRALLQQERIAVISRLGKVAHERGAAFVLVAGDFFDSVSPTKATVSAACSAVGAVGLPVYVISGNHDHGGPGSVWTQPFFKQAREQLAPNLHVLLEAAPVEVEGALLFPCPLLRRHEAGDPTAWLRHLELAGGGSGNKPRILLAHGSVQGFGQTHGSDHEDDGAAVANFIDLNRLPAADWDYMALGDWHGWKAVGEKAWYSGTPEYDRFPKGEGNLPGHVMVVTAERGQPPQVEAVPVARFGWHQLQMTLHDDAGLAQCEAAVDALLERRSGEDLLLLELDGRLGIAAMSRLESLLESWQSRLLRLKLSNRTTVAPSEEEVAALTQRLDDPLISSVSTRLVALAAGEGPEAEVARLALRELHAASVS